MARWASKGNGSAGPDNRRGGAGYTDRRAIAVEIIANGLKLLVPVLAH